MRAAVALALWAVCFYPAAVAAQKPIVAYYGGWNGAGGVSSVPWAWITQVNVAFAGLDAQNRCAWMDMDNTDEPDTSSTIPQAINALIQARNANNPNVKIVLSVGGDVMSYRFSHALSQLTGIQTVAQSCVGLMRLYGMDGIDYDWEYPGRLGAGNCPNVASAPQPCADRRDAAHFTLLLAATRALLGAAAPLSAAVFDNLATTPSNNALYDYAGLQTYLTYVNIMEYSVKGWPGDRTTGHNAPFSGAQGTLQFFAKQGVAPSKLLLGVPFYGAYWSNVQSSAVGSAGTPQGTLDYAQIEAQWSSDAQCNFNRSSDGAYYYCPTGRHAGCWLSVDDPDSMLQKATYVRQNGYGGMMFWAVPGDTQDFALSRALWRGLEVNAALVDIWSDPDPSIGIHALRQ